MRNKKFFLISFVLINIFFLTILYVMFSLVSRFNTEVKYIADDTIYIANDYGYKTEYINDVNDMTNVSSSKFISDTSCNAGYNLENKKEKEMQYVWISSDCIYDNNSIQDSLKFLAGSPMNNKGEIIISSFAADWLIENNKAKSYEDLIGKKSDSGDEIVGVYEKQKSSNDYVYIADSVNINISFQHASYKLADDSKNTNVEDAINDLNNILAYQYQDGYNYRNDYIVSSYEEGEGSIIDYDASVAKGAKGLMDPKTDDYGDSFKTIGIIEVSDESKKQEVMDELEKSNSEQVILSSSSKLSDFRRVNLFFPVVIIAMVLVNIVLLFPYFKFKR